MAINFTFTSATLDPGGQTITICAEGPPGPLPVGAAGKIPAIPAAYTVRIDRYWPDGSQKTPAEARAEAIPLMRAQRAARVAAAVLAVTGTFQID